VATRSPRGEQPEFHAEKSRDLKWYKINKKINKIKMTDISKMERKQTHHLAFQETEDLRKKGGDCGLTLSQNREQCSLLVGSAHSQIIVYGCKGKKVKVFLSYHLSGRLGTRCQRPQLLQGQHIEGGAHLLSLAALRSLILKRAGTH